MLCNNCFSPLLFFCCCGFQRAEGHWCVCVHPDRSLRVNVSHFEGKNQQRSQTKQNKTKKFYRYYHSCESKIQTKKKIENLDIFPQYIVANSHVRDLMCVMLFHFVYHFFCSFCSVHPNACAVWCVPLHGSSFTQWSAGTLMRFHIVARLSLLGSRFATPSKRRKGFILAFGSVKGQNCNQFIASTFCLISCILYECYIDC